MYRLLLLGLLGLIGCKSTAEPPPAQTGGVRVTAPGVNISVQDQRYYPPADPR